MILTQSVGIVLVLGRLFSVLFFFLGAFVFRLWAILFFWDLPGNRRREKFVFRTRGVCQNEVDHIRTNHWNSSVAVRMKNSVLVTDARNSFSLFFFFID